jgi:hypothetical protein
VIHPRDQASWERGKEAFWGVVQDCLVEIHDLPKRQAATLAAGLRKRIETPPPGVVGEIFYHAEPFDVACDLAQRRLNIRDHARQYSALLSRHFRAE